MLVNLIFDLYADVIFVPDDIGENLKKYQRKYDKWLFGCENQFWVKDETGRKLGVHVTAEGFLYWLNEFVLKDSDEKAYLIEGNKNIDEVNKSLHTIYY